MKKRILTEKLIEQFNMHLIAEEKSEITIAKYLSDVRQFCKFAKYAQIE